MLEELQIKDLALISEAKLEFGAGLNVLSGETGAGKTVLLSAIKLALGERADSDSIRKGSDEASVQARFYFDDSNEELIVKRSISQSGRSKASINDEMLTLKSLNEELGPHIDLHGQHDHQALLKAKSHINLLDAFIGDAIDEPLVQYAKARADYKNIKKNLDSLLVEQKASEDEISLLNLSLAEIDRVNPLEQEDEILSSELPELMHAEEISAAAAKAHAHMSAEGGAHDALVEALSALSQASTHHRSLAEASERLKALLPEVSDLSETLRDVSYSVEYDESRLDYIQERLMQLDALKKRFGPSLERVIAKRAEIAHKLNSIEHADEELERLQSELAQARQALEECAARLKEIRQAQISSFITSLRESVADLALENAQFEIEVTELDFDSWNSKGPSSYEILYSSSAFSTPRPLAKIASGGELSRVMLGLKTILGSDDKSSVLIFDEIDAGIGGAVATSVGRKLALLAKSHQILVVTHLAQVAAFADQHYLVEKSETSESVDTGVRALSSIDRVSEIARMLSGQDSELAHKHAEELLLSADKLIHEKR